MLFLSANEIRPIGLVDFPQFPLSLDIGAVHLLCPASAQVPAPAAALAAAAHRARRTISSRWALVVSFMSTERIFCTSLHDQYTRSSWVYAQFFWLTRQISP